MRITMIKDTFPYSSSNLKFNKKGHIYTYNDTRMLSVTSWLAQYKEPFNSIRISEEVSKNPRSQYYGIEPKEIRKLWQKTSVRGTKKHSEIEKWLIGESEKCPITLLNKLNILPNNSWSEIAVFSSRFCLAGTIDIISVFDNEYRIWDIKTVTRLDKDKIEEYSLQILTYCILLKEMIGNTDVKILPGGIIHIPPADWIGANEWTEFKEPKLIDVSVDVNLKLKNMLKQRLKDVNNSK